MPTSDFSVISFIMRLVEKENPNSILDIGAGWGKYGVLCRELLDIKHGRLKPEEWQVRIDCIEIYSEYENPNYHVYNNVYWHDCRKIRDILEIDYNVCLMIDILEHLTIEEGKKIINYLKQHSDVIIISTPSVFHKQVSEINPHENHISFWDRNLIEEHGICYRIGNQLIGLM